jgi:hypothetical protein
MLGEVEEAVVEGQGDGSRERLPDSRRSIADRTSTTRYASEAR